MKRIQFIWISVLVVLCSTEAQAQWVENGIAVCVCDGIQEQPRIVSDDAGGAIIIWVDRRSGDQDIYAQRINEDGLVMWQEGGVAICIADYNQIYPQVIADGAGGAIITWQDFRMGHLPHHRYQYKIFAQRIGSDGNTLWVDNGNAVSTTRGNQRRPVLVSDGWGGAIIAWRGRKSYVSGIYAQRLSRTGMPQWQSQGSAVCAGVWTMSYDEFPDITTDDSGGAVITWRDYRNGTDWDVYAQRMLSGGNPRWTTNGINISAKQENQIHPHIVNDGAGGAIIVWRDGNDNYDVFAQKISADGAILWPEKGLPVCALSGDQRNARLVSDEAGGCIVGWDSGWTYAQKILANGDMVWEPNGVPLNLYSLHYGVQLVFDGSGGAIIGGYETYSSACTPIIAHKLDSEGQTSWRKYLSEESGLRKDVRLVFDGEDGVIAAWHDHRNDEGDIYAMRTIPVLEIELDIRPASCPNPLNPKSRGILNVAIPGTSDLDASMIDVSTVMLEGVSPFRWKYEDVTTPSLSEEECACTEAGPDGIMDITMKFSVPDIVSNLGDRISDPRVELKIVGALTDNTEIEGTDCVVIRGKGPVAHKENRKMLSAAMDSRPEDPVQKINYYLPQSSVVQAAVYDVSGRLIKSFDASNNEAGMNVLEWHTEGLPSGMYFFRIKSDSEVRSVKVILLR